MTTDGTQTIRIDKYLWAVRLFKTRSLAAAACEKHHVLIAGAEVKPSRAVKAGDLLTVKRLPVVYTYRVVALVGNRQPAALVKNYIIDETPQSERDKLELARLAFIQRDRGAGRPTKKERRTIEKIFDEE